MHQRIAATSAFSPWMRGGQMRAHIKTNDVDLAAKRIAEAGGVLMVMHSLGQRGGERVAAILANGFADAGIPVRIVLLRDDAGAENELRAMLHTNISVRSAGPRLRVPGGKHLERARAVPFIRNQVRSFKPAVVFCTINSLALTTALCRGDADTGRSFALKLTNPIVPPNMTAARKLIRRKTFAFAFSRFDLAITLSEADRRKALETYPARDALFRRLPNAYVTSDMLTAPAPSRAGFPRIVASGALVPRKRIDLLLQAFALSDSKSATLTILGDGPLRPKLQDLARSLGVADRVHMPGFTDDVVAWLRNSDLFVLPSDYEGLPAVVLEAFACGVPVVSTDSFASAHELLDGLAGCEVVPTASAESLAAAIDRSISSTAEPTELRRVAHDYLIENSIDAHIFELGRIVKAHGEPGADIPLKPALQSAPAKMAPANDDIPIRRFGKTASRVAAIIGLVSAGWLLHDIAGPITSPAQASVFVDDAVSAHRAKLISDAMETTPEVVRYDRAALAKATGIRMPHLPAAWKVDDVEVLPRSQGVNLLVQLPDGTRLSVFGMKTHALVSGYPIPDKRDRENVVYWGEGNFTFAVVGSLPQRTLLTSVASIDPDGPALTV